MDAYTFKTSQSNLITVMVNDTWGGKEVVIDTGYELHELITWLRVFKQKEQADSLVRDNNEFVKGLYDQYKTALELARKNNAVI